MSKLPTQKTRAKFNAASNDQSLSRILRDIGKTTPLSRAEEVRQIRKLKDGDPSALEKLTAANLKFVVSIASQFQGRSLTLGELINEGTIGLITAIKRFDETRGPKLISYAVWWIRQAILQALAVQGRIVRLPQNQVGALNRQRKVDACLQQEFGREPSMDELAQRQGISEDHVTQMAMLAPGHLSLDTPFADDNDETPLDALEDKYAPSPADVLRAKELSIEIEKVITTLTDREAEVINLFFGIGEPRPWTLEEIGDRYSLTRERIRQIKDKAIRRLKHASRSLPLRRFLEKYE